MKKYTVMLNIKGSIEVEVEADDAEEAVEIARGGDFDTSLNNMELDEIDPCGVMDENGVYTQVTD